MCIHWGIVSLVEFSNLCREVFCGFFKFTELSSWFFICPVMFFRCLLCATHYARGDFGSAYWSLCSQGACGVVQIQINRWGKVMSQAFKGGSLMAWKCASGRRNRRWRRGGPSVVRNCGYLGKGVVLGPAKDPGLYPESVGALEGPQDWQWCACWLVFCRDLWQLCGEGYWK